MHLLIIDTSTERGLIAYCQDHVPIHLHFLPFGLNQSKTLMTDLQTILAPLGYPPPSLDFIGVTVGPGSYTGIRIGIAVAQSLAYAWKLPLVGVPSLHGFVPIHEGSYAAVIDARIGGVYFLKGKKEQQTITYEGEPQVAPLEEAYQQLKTISCLVTPYAQVLKTKLLHVGQWEESAPSAEALAKSMLRQIEQGKVVIPPQQVPILYLRETEAERARQQKII